MKQIDSKLLGTRIRKAREDVGLSQTDLAHKLGKDQRVISAIERGLRGLDVTELPPLAEALNVSILYFFGEALSPSDLDNEILAYFHNLPSSNLKNAAISIVRTLSELKNE